MLSIVALLGGGCRDPAEPEATAESRQALRWAATFDNNPLHDAVVRINATNSGLSCTATLISSRVLLTAAHCVVDNGVNSNGLWVNYARSIDIWTEGSSALPIRVAARCFMHPSAYSNPTCWSGQDPQGPSVADDVAVLVLNRRLAPDLAAGLSRQARLDTVNVPFIRPYFRSRDGTAFELSSWDVTTVESAGYGVRVWPQPLGDLRRLADFARLNYPGASIQNLNQDFPFSFNPPVAGLPDQENTRGDSGGPSLWNCFSTEDCRTVAVDSGLWDVGVSYFSRMAAVGRTSTRQLIMGVVDPAGRHPDPGYSLPDLYGDLDRFTNPPDDPDGDGLTTNGNGRDNCPLVPNPDQLDSDFDDIGDACECPSQRTIPGITGSDSDRDGLPDECDNCPTVQNSGQENSDSDADGDACDRCPGTVSSNAIDGDGDGWPNACDLCPGTGVSQGDVSWPTVQPNCNGAMEQATLRTPRGDACDPLPCTTIFTTSSQGAELGTAAQPTLNPPCAPDYLGVGPGTCGGGSGRWSFGYAPRVGAIPFGDSFDLPIPSASEMEGGMVTGLSRCVCRGDVGGTAIRVPPGSCAALACTPLSSPIGQDNGYGWLPAEMQMPAGYPRATQRDVPSGVVSSVYDGPVLAADFVYRSRSSTQNAFDLWHLGDSTVSPAIPTAVDMNWEWLALRAQAGLPWIQPYSQPWNSNSIRNPWPPGTVLVSPQNGPPPLPDHVMFGTRAQNDVEPLQGSLVFDAQQLQTHIMGTPQAMVPAFEQPREVLAWPVNWWQNDVIWLFPPRPDPPFFTDRAAIVSRDAYAVFPITSRTPAAAGVSKWQYGSPTQPVRGLVIANLALRTVRFSATIATEGAESDLPMWADSAYALSLGDATTGWPRLYAFGGRDADGTLRRNLYAATPQASASGLPTYHWAELSNETLGPTPRDRATLAVSGDGSRVFLIGGRGTGNVALGDVWSFHVPTGQWSLLTHLPARYDAGACVRGNEIFVGGGIGPGGQALGDLIRVQGTSGVQFSYGNALPTGGLPFLNFDENGDGLVYGGGYVGSTWYRDLWRIDLFEQYASTWFLHDFSSNGMPASERFAMVPDVHHGFYWALPGYNGSASVLGVWLRARGVVEQIKPGSASTMLRMSSSSDGGAPVTSEREFEVTLRRTLPTQDVRRTNARTSRSPLRLPPTRAPLRRNTVVSEGGSRVIP